MRRRAVLKGVATSVSVGVAGCASGSGGDRWDGTQSFGGRGSRQIHISEMEEGNELEMKATITEGNNFSLFLRNLNTNERVLEKTIFRDDRLDSYQEDNDSHKVSPYTTTYTTQDFGEFRAMLASSYSVSAKFQYRIL